MKTVSYWLIRRVALDLINFQVAHCFSFFLKYNYLAYLLAAWLPDRVKFATPSLFWLENNEKRLSCFSPALRVNLTRWRWHRKTRGRDDRISLTLFISPRVICIMQSACPDELFSQSELSSFMNCLSWRLAWWAFTTIWPSSSNRED